MKKALELRGIGKRFGPVHANRNASLAVPAGTVHALVGENGAGKSTLMKIAYGHVQADEGTVVLKGEAIPAGEHSPRRAIDRGVGMVHQHFMLVGPLTVVENIVLGREPLRRGLLDLDRAAGELTELSERFGLEVDPRARIDDLSVGQQQRVEILKVLWQGCDVLILDEPTAVLTPAEVRQLFDVLRGLVAGGMTVILITHKLDEIKAIADRITVMRRGETVGELDAATATPEQIARAMVGRPVLLQVDKGPASPGRPMLELRGVVAAGRAGARAIAIDSLSVAAGEIVGIAGVEGNGQTELIEAICGLRPATAGTITLAGRDVTSASVRARYEGGLAHIPEDRHARGLVLTLSVADNLVLGRQREFSRPTGLDRERIRDHAERCIGDFDIRPADRAARAAQLSGGNQQKIVVARELTRPAPRLLVCAQPTRGVDIGAIESIHKSIVAARDRGLAVLLVSAELSELRALSDRLLVLYRGRISGTVGAEDLARPDIADHIGELMTGARESA
jgi:simple sugar transport system ATP-binding protein